MATAAVSASPGTPQGIPPLPSHALSNGRGDVPEVSGASAQHLRYVHLSCGVTSHRAARPVQTGNHPCLTQHNSRACIGVPKACCIPSKWLSRG